MIYTVKSGDTLSGIASSFGTTTEILSRVNSLTNPNNLSVGQNLFIPSESQTPTTYTVVSGDTLYLIARKFGITLQELLRANPQIQNPNFITIGQEINIPSGKRSIVVNGYAIASISDATLQKSLPSLTFLSIFSYQAKPDGSLTGLYEQSLIEQAIGQRVAPIMVVTNIGENGGFDSDLGRTILNNNTVRSTLISNIISTLNSKNYSGVNIDFEYLYPEDRNSYIDFLRALKNELVKYGYILTVAVAPKYRDNQTGLLYEAHDYRAIGQIADYVIIMTYEWGYVYGEPMAISPLREVEYVISYAVTRIPSEKILMGMPNYAYDWKVPFESGDMAMTLSNIEANNLAFSTQSTIMFDSSSAAPYFNYTNENTDHVVWFDDPRSIDERLNLVTKYNLGGVSFWTINSYYAPNFSVLENKFDVTKIIN